MDLWFISRAIIGCIFVLFIPGFAWSLVFFDKKEIDIIERVALSVGLSIALVSLTIFWLNWLFGVEIILINTVVIITVLTGIPMACYFLNKNRLVREEP